MSEFIKIQIQPVEGAEDLMLPKKATPGSSGYDLCARLDFEVVLEPMEIVLIPLGFRMSIPEGYEAQIRPRSGLAYKNGITLPNSPGTIDSDYRGEVKVPLINLGSKSFTIKNGDRIAQMIISAVAKTELEKVSFLDSSERGSGGFGHTGVAGKI